MMTALTVFDDSYKEPARHLRANKEPQAIYTKMCVKKHPQTCMFLAQGCQGTQKGWGWFLTRV